MVNLIYRFSSIALITIPVLYGCTVIPRSNNQDPEINIQGKITDGIYSSPDNLYRINVPVMSNPFIKYPTLISDEWRDGGGTEVNFSVYELGEAWKFGAIPFKLPDPVESELLKICDEELARWLNNPGIPNVILEEKIEHTEGSGIARIYYQDNASLLFVSQGRSTPKQESALIGVIVILSGEKELLLYAVGQFDMPNRGGHYTLDTENGRIKLAENHLSRIKMMSATQRFNTERH